MLDNIKRFDMKKEPARQGLKPLVYYFSLPEVKSHKWKLKKVNMDGIKPPYLIFGNHNAFLDMKVLNVLTKDVHANYVVAIDGFIKRENLLRKIGGICKRKFTNDPYLVKQLKRVLDRGDVAVIYPEARYSLCGTTSLIPDNLGRLAKFYDVPVVTVLCHGHHINSPFWNLHNRKIKGIQTEMTCVATLQEVRSLSAQEIQDRIVSHLQYDDFAWQKENDIHIKYKKNSEGLHKVLYQCPHCHSEYEMCTFGTTIKCNHCKKEWLMTELGELKAKNGETEFSHIPDWYEWEREQVKKQIEEGKYYFESEVHVDSLPNAKGFIHLGKAKLIHDMNGFLLKGKYKDEEYEVKLDARYQYSVHIEYEYLGKYGDCVDLNTPNDTLYVYPECDKFSVTKISLATEELFKYYNKSR